MIKNRKIITQDIIVYDIETIYKKKTNNEAVQCFASAVCYSYNNDSYSFYLHESGKMKMLSQLQGQKTVSFYGINFDSKVLLGNRQIKVCSHPGVKLMNNRYFWYEYDIYTAIMQSIYHTGTFSNAIHKQSPGGYKLDQICENTICKGKSGHGKDAPNLYKNRQFADLLSYNLQDVRITKQLFDFILKNKYIYSQKRKKIIISY